MDMSPHKRLNKEGRVVGRKPFLAAKKQIVLNEINAVVAALKKARNEGNYKEARVLTRKLASLRRSLRE